MVTNRGLLKICRDHYKEIDQRLLGIVAIPAVRAHLGGDCVVHEHPHGRIRAVQPLDGCTQGLHLVAAPSGLNSLRRHLSRRLITSISGQRTPAEVWVLAMHTLKTDSNAGVTSPLVQALQSYEWGLWRSLKFHFHIPAAWKVIRDQACVGG